MSVLYTVMPLEAMFAVGTVAGGWVDRYDPRPGMPGSDFGSPQGPQPDMAGGGMAAPSGGVMLMDLGRSRYLEVIPGHAGLGTVCRLHSTDPADYLQPAWQPGVPVRLF